MSSQLGFCAIFLFSCNITIYVSHCRLQPVYFYNIFYNCPVPKNSPHFLFQRCKTFFTIFTLKHLQQTKMHVCMNKCTPSYWLPLSEPSPNWWPICFFNIHNSNLQSSLLARTHDSKIGWQIVCFSLHAIRISKMKSSLKL